MFSFDKENNKLNRIKLLLILVFCLLLPQSVFSNDSIDQQDEKGVIVKYVDDV